MNTYAQQLKGRKLELVSNVLQLFAGLWFWLISVAVILPLSVGHPVWAGEQHNQTTYLIQELNLQTNSVKNHSRLRLPGLKLGV